jgi:RNA polymerase sigma-70 factor (ECF subfamily)
MTGNYDQALELTQEVFVKAYQSLDRFDSRYRFTTWIYHIATNRAIDHLRKKRPWHYSLGNDDSRDGRPTPAALRSGRPSPYEEVRAKELNRKIQAEILQLPPTYRDLIVLRHFNHMRYDEIARIRRLPLGTVKNRIFRAREMLRRAVFSEANR